MFQMSPHPSYEKMLLNNVHVLLILIPFNVMIMCCFRRSKLPLKKKVALRTRAYRGKKEHKNKQGDKSSPSHSANKKRVSSYFEVIVRIAFCY